MLILLKLKTSETFYIFTFIYFIPAYVARIIINISINTNIYIAGIR